MIRKQSPRQKIRNRARYWDSDYLAGFIKGLKIRQEYEYQRGMHDLHEKIVEKYGLDDYYTDNLKFAPKRRADYE